MKDFFEQYELWKAECMEELRNKDIVFDWDEDKVDICENGQVYFGNLHITQAGFVTPWEESKYFVEIS
jgi:hypothetical protein